MRIVMKTFVSLCLIIGLTAGCTPFTVLTQASPSPARPPETLTPGVTATPPPTSTSTITPEPTITATPTLTSTPTRIPRTPISAASIQSLSVLAEFKAIGQVDGLAFLPDGHSLVYSAIGRVSELGMVNIDNVEDRYFFSDANQDAYCRNGAASSYSIDITEDGTLLAATAPSGVQVWRLPEKKLLYTFPFLSAGIVQFSPDGSLLAVGICSYFDTEPENIYEGIKIWDMRSGNQVEVLEGHVVEAIRISRAGNTKILTNFFMQLLFSEDGKALLSGGPDPQSKTGIKIWDANSGEIVQSVSISPYKGAVATSLDFNQSGDTLLTLDQAYEPAIRLWKFENGSIADPNPIQTIKMDRDYGLAKFNHKGDLIFTVSTEPMVLVVWSVDTQKIVYQEELSPEMKIGHYSTISLDISQDDTVLAVGGWPGFVRLYAINQ